MLRDLPEEDTIPFLFPGFFVKSNSVWLAKDKTKMTKKKTEPKVR